MLLSELENTFQPVIASMTGLDANSKVRVSWPTDGAPAWKITDDIAFIQVTEEDSPINRQRDVWLSYTSSPEVQNQETTYTRVIKLALMLYGPNSFAYAQTVRDLMFYETYREILALKKLYLIPDMPSPRRFPELFENRWWERVDMSMLFNELVSINLAVPFITSAEVLVYDESGQVADVKI